MKKFLITALEAWFEGRRQYINSRLSLRTQ